MLPTQLLSVSCKAKKKRLEEAVEENPRLTLRARGSILRATEVAVEKSSRTGFEKPVTEWIPYDTWREEHADSESPDERDISYEDPEDLGVMIKGVNVMVGKKNHFRRINETSTQVCLPKSMTVGAFLVL